MYENREVLLPVRYKTARLKTDTLNDCDVINFGRKQEMVHVNDFLKLVFNKQNTNNNKYTLTLLLLWFFSKITVHMQWTENL